MVRHATKHRIALLLALGGILISAELMVLPELLTTSTSSARAKDWVQAHADSLPATLDEISSYDLALRRQIFIALPAETRASLWREHLQAILRTRENLTTDQRRFLEKAKEILTPKVYSDFKSVAKAPLELTLLCAEAKRLFPGEPNLFGQLGPAQPTYASYESRRLRLVDWAREKMLVHALGNENRLTSKACECHHDSWCSCDPCGGGCETSNSGCGCLWMYECNGWCL